LQEVDKRIPQCEKSGESLDTTDKKSEGTSIRPYDGSNYDLSERLAKGRFVKVGGETTNGGFLTTPIDAKQRFEYKREFQEDPEERNVTKTPPQPHAHL